MLAPGASVLLPRCLFPSFLFPRFLVSSFLFARFFPPVFLCCFCASFIFNLVYRLFLRTFLLVSTIYFFLTDIANISFSISPCSSKKK